MTRFILVFFLVYVSSWHQLMADTGISSGGSCKRCSEEPSLGKFLWSGQSILTSTNLIEGIQVGDVFWSPGQRSSGEGGETIFYPEKWVVADIDINTSNVVYTLRVFSFDLPKSATVQNWADKEFWECSGILGFQRIYGFTGVSKQTGQDYSSPAGQAKFQPPQLSNKGAGDIPSGCSSCSTPFDGKNGEFELSINLGNENGSDLPWRFAGDMTKADLLNSSSIESFTELSMHPGVTVSGNSMNGTLEIWDVTTLNLPPAQWIKTSSVTFESEMETTNPAKIKNLKITVTPVDASNPGSIVHEFERVTELLTPQSSVELEGVQYKRTSRDGEVETLKFLNLGVDGRTADGGMIGTFRVVHPNGEKETMTTIPGTYTWQPSGGALNGGSFLADPPLREQHEIVAPGSSMSRQNDRIYRKIGSQTRNELALASETTTTAGHVETTLFGYDERVTLAWFQENKEFGRERWQSRTDGSWSLNLCSAPLKVGQVPVMFRRLVDGVGCIG